MVATSLTRKGCFAWCEQFLDISSSSQEKKSLEESLTNNYVIFFVLDVFYNLSGDLTLLRTAAAIRNWLLQVELIRDCMQIIAEGRGDFSISTW